MPVGRRALGRPEHSRRAIATAFARRRLRDGLREARLLGDGACWGWLVFPISTIVGGWAWRPTAAASGRAASIATLVSGRWARGNSGYTIPGLSLTASPASRLGQVI